MYHIGSGEWVRSCSSTEEGARYKFRLHSGQWSAQELTNTEDIS